MATTYLTRTPSSTGNRKIFTISAWIKRSKTGNNQKVITAGTSGTEGGLQFSTGTGENCLKFYEYVGSEVISIAPNRILRDTSAWYHVVIAVDTTQATASNRVKYYLNGVQETSFATATYPSQNYDTLFNNSGTANTIGFLIGHSAYFDGYMSHIHFIDGTAYDASAFGETDATTGEWTIKTSPSVTYGNNGFFILKDGNSVTDQSGNGNNFTVAGGTLTDTLDCPDNVFATLNALVYSSASKTYGHGNNSITASDSGNWCSTQSTIGASSGKYYCEIKINSVGSYQAIGVAYQPNVSNTTSTQLIGELTGSAGWRNNGALVHGGSNINTYTTGDILMIAMDLDNQKLYFGKNGTWENSGVPTSGSTGTGSLKDLTANEFYHFVICPRGGSNYCNFGNGYFGTTAVSSAGTNASGNGIFEYDVPTGYTALSTKGLNL
jgi:hypothetical protein